MSMTAPKKPRAKKPSIYSVEEFQLAFAESEKAMRQILRTRILEDAKERKYSGELLLGMKIAADIVWSGE